MCDNIVDSISGQEARILVKGKKLIFIWNEEC
ncbi:hypothetical protein SAMN06298214_0469 [Bacteroidales bacterium WCE2004]|nr:hypothetical protein SAMN06298214_0469 [Bacteroidales bacterium WCE2004]